jgi:hypothetical protein
VSGSYCTSMETLDRSYSRYTQIKGNIVKPLIRIHNLPASFPTFELGTARHTKDNCSLTGIQISKQALLEMPTSANG